MNDRDAFLANVWRAIRNAPDEVAYWCDQPPNEADQHAVHTWLVGQRETFTARLMGDPDYYDAQIAGRWLYGICCWIGSGWCVGKGPWQSIDGQLTHLGNAGRGVHRQRTHLGNAGQDTEGLYAWMQALATRLRYVRVCCGDWTRVLGPSVTTTHGLTGIVLDPPYAAEEGRVMQLYAEDSGTVAHDVRAWCLVHGNNPLLRIVLCGYSSTHDVLLQHGWTKASWQANGGYGNQGQGAGRGNAHRETLWLSPHCVQESQLSLFATLPQQVALL